MRIYDTLRKAIVDFVPRVGGEVSLYACGPTVYDHPHLGHARQALTYDMARRYFEWDGYRVHHVANITDIDDKIIERAMQEGRTEVEVAAEWERVYLEVMDDLNILRPHDYPHATGYVDEMISFIAELVDNDSAYVTESGVYLRVRSVPDYGALVHRTPDELTEGAGARVEVDPNKEDPLDFALWKAAKPGEPTWAAPWGSGRPGWHIECAAMSLGILGDGFDLHGGGDDLVFPHHTNERAEALAAGRTFARYWMHNAMLNIGGEKMSKSLDNFTTVRDLLDEHPQNARALRLLIFQTHYRKTLEVNPDAMAQTREGLDRMDSLVRKANAAGVDYLDAESHRAIVGAFREAMEDDFGTPEALAEIFKAVRAANKAIDGELTGAAELVAAVIELTGVLGIPILSDPSAAEDDPEIQSLVDARSAAKESKDYAEADRLRDELAARAVIIEDTPTGTVWRRE